MSFKSGLFLLKLKATDHSWSNGNIQIRFKVGTLWIRQYIEHRKALALLKSHLIMMNILNDVYLILITVRQIIQRKAV